MTGPVAPEVRAMTGAAALPRRNGELAFEAPWEGRAFGMAIGVVESLGLPWSAFQSQLIAAIAADPDRPYYESWLAARRIPRRGAGDSVDTMSETVAVTAPVTVDHPLAMLTAEEVRAAVAILRADERIGPDAPFVHVVLHEPAKAELLAWAPGDPVDREVRALAVTGPGLHLVEAIVSVTTGELRHLEVVEGMRPALLFGESIDAVVKVKEHPEWQAAMRKRGITDLDNVQIDPWPAGNFGIDHETDRRISRCLAYVREHAQDNGYARPVEGVIAYFDSTNGEVLEVVDYGEVPLPPQGGGYLADDVGPVRTDLKPLDILQPEGPSFTVDGNLVQWQKWSFRVGFDPYEGLVLHTVTYDDGGRTRPVLHRASISEMVVPYGDPGPMHGWKNAFDAGEWGLGRLANPLVLGCDCLGAIHYFDAILTTEQGDPYTVERVICMHEEDYGILWKHRDLHGDTDETRRSRRLVVSFIATVGNYEYGFYWYFYQDGNIQLEVKLTGIISSMAVAPGDIPGFAGMVAPGLAGPNHQHLFCVAPRPRRRRHHEPCARGRGRAAAAGAQQPVGERASPAGHAAGDGAGVAPPHERRDLAALAHREHRRDELGRPTHGVPAAADGQHAHAVRTTGVERGEARRLRPLQPLGHALRARRAARRG